MSTDCQRVLLIEDHPLLRKAIRQLIQPIANLQLIGEAADGATGWMLWQKLKPELVVLDLHLPDGNGMMFVRQNHLFKPPSRILIFSSDGTQVSVTAALAAGVHGYALKTDPIAELERALHTVSSGRMYLSPDIVPIALGRSAGVNEPPPISTLSPREQETLRLLALGFRTKEAAAQLGVSTKTAETFRRRLMAKLGLGSIADLTRYAIRQGIVSA